MRKLILFLILLMTTGVLAAQSNAEPSLKIALHPCVLFSGSLPANTRADMSIHACNIPSNVTSLDVNVIVTATAAGSLKVWEADMTEPSPAIMTYGSGTTAGFAEPRACAPYGECAYGISAKATSDITLTLVAVAAYVPPN